MPICFCAAPKSPSTSYKSHHPLHTRAKRRTNYVQLFILWNYSPFTFFTVVVGPAHINQSHHRNQLLHPSFLVLGLMPTPAIYPIPYVHTSICVQHLL